MCLLNGMIQVKMDSDIKLDIRELGQLDRVNAAHLLTGAQKHGYLYHFSFFTLTACTL